MTEVLQNKFEEVTSKFKSFCDLCKREIKKEEIVRQARGEPNEENEWMGEKYFIIHLDCSKVKERQHKQDFLENRERFKSTAVKQSKKVFNTSYDDKVIYCCGCSKLIQGEYVKDGKQRRTTWHLDCFKKKKARENRTKSSLR